MDTGQLAELPPGTDPRRAAELLFRRRGAQLTATLARVFGIERFDLVEDVTQEAFLRALRVWPTSGIPDQPVAWLLTVAKNRALDVIRRERLSDEKRQQVEESILPSGADVRGPLVYFGNELEDDELRLIFATCHPALSRDAQVAITLKTACGLGADEIARAFLTTAATIAQRIVRAKRALRAEAVVLEIPGAAELPARVEAVSEVLYLLFNEGYSATAGDRLLRRELCAEAIRLADRLAWSPHVGGPSAHALAALFLFQTARFAARANPAGELVPLAEQDRTLWDRRLIRRALEHHRLSARGHSETEYHLEAEIAGCHTLAPSFEETDWGRIRDRYDALWALKPTPVVALNRAVALSYVEGPDVALEALRHLEGDPRLQRSHRLFSVEAELLSRAGQSQAALEAISAAIELATSAPLKEYLTRRRAEYARGAGDATDPEPDTRRGGER